MFHAGVHSLNTDSVWFQRRKFDLLKENVKGKSNFVDSKYQEG